MGRNMMVGALLALAACGPGAPHGGAVDWNHDPQAGFAEAQSADRRLMVYFTAEW